MADGEHRGATLAATCQPAFKYTQPAIVKIAAGFIKQQQRRRQRLQACHRDHSALGNVEIERMRLGYLTELTQH